MKKLMAVLGLTLMLGAGPVAFVYAEDLDADMDSSASELTFQTIEGTLEQIDGTTLVVAEYITNYRGEEIKDKEMRVQVNDNTKLIHGTKSVGDPVRVDVTSAWVATSIQ
jgi:hypothetical protein